MNHEIIMIFLLVNFFLLVIFLSVKLFLLVNFFISLFYFYQLILFFIFRSVSNASRLNKLTGLHLIMFFDLKREVRHFSLIAK